MINRRQIKAARSLLEWSQGELGEFVGVERNTIANIESGRTSPKSTIENIQKTLENHGIEFLPSSGVRMKDQVVTVLDGVAGEQSLLDDVYQTCKASGGEVLIYGVHGESPLNYKEFREMVVEHVNRLQAAGLSQRVLKREGDRNFIAAPGSYRWVDVEETVPVPVYVYEDKVAFSQLTEPRKTIIIENPLIAQSVRHLFNFAWGHAKPIPEEKEKKSKSVKKKKAKAKQ